ncbi:MAG: carbohydrate binding domain-containing protein [Bacteroidales bacterium]|nr:carbohydrate binding domain-containing protein [Bacteroidales bacterium]
MKTIHLFLSLLAGVTTMSAQVPTSQADSAWLFTYATTKNAGHNGLHFAWSTDCSKWHEIGPEWAPVKSDYGPWGAQKRMLDPRVRYNAATRQWEATWRLNEREDLRALTRSTDMVLWKPQDYYPATRIPQELIQSDTTTLTLDFSGTVRGQMHRVAWPVVYKLIESQQVQAQRAALHSERAIDDLKGRFAHLEPQHISINVQTEGRKQISDKLIGIFFEDINYAADGGLYAELLQNRDFEYNAKDGRGWEPMSWWQVKGASAQILTDNPIHPNNPHYLSLQVGQEQTEVTNLGWEGIPVKAGAKYRFSLFGRVPEGKASSVQVQLVSKDGTVLASSKVSLSKGQSWKKVNATLRATADAQDAVLRLVMANAGTYQLDMVSLFPFDTYKGRINGMRRDLAEALEALHPQFVRFPGGCVAHGNGLDNMYRWKNTIGPLEARKPDWNIWHYHQSFGLGFYEYFQLCEDLGARPLPVLAAGVPCQNSGVGGNGQQGGLPMDQMDEYIQDVLDLIEYANGDPKTSQWAKMRAEAGHPKPFGLKMIGIGNEDLISDVFTERYKMICKAVQSKYPDIEVVGTAGPFYEGSDYEYGWRLARELNLDHIDEHYYNSPGWFINNQDFYDRYARTYNGKPSTKVYLGEYASHINGRKNCLETALSEALYLCSVERNGDIVSMTSYAPLFAKEKHTQWNPDMIYFNNNEVKPTTGYQVQRLFGTNSGTTYLPSQVRLEHPDAQVRKRVGSSAVIDPATGDLILKLVNYLPVANSIQYTLPLDAPAVVSATVLTGQLSDTRAVPAPLQGVQADGNQLSLEVPAYSLVVLRVSQTTTSTKK